LLGSPTWLTTPSFTTSSLAGVESCLDAISTNAALASAAAWRSPLDHCVLMDWLPEVVPWSGVRQVSPWTRSILLRATSSSSAAICIWAVLSAVPSSTLPTKIVTRPFCPTAIHESICCGSTSAGPIADVAPRAFAAPTESGNPKATMSAPLPFRKSRREWGVSMMFVTFPPPYAVARAARLTALTMR
jgi:hypothetical protein